MSYGKFLDESRVLDNRRREKKLPYQDYEKTFVEVRDIWIKDERYAELIAFINENWDSGNGDDFFRPLSAHLLKTKELRHFKSLWKGILRHRMRSFWNDLKYIMQEYPKITVDEIKHVNTDGFNQFSSTESDLRSFSWSRKFILEGITTYNAGLLQFNDVEEIEQLKKQYESIAHLKKPKLKKTTDKRKIDEKVFWELIESNRNASEDKMDFIEKLSHQLEGFKPIEIKRFERIFLTKYQELNRWDIWALAYISRRGCGDDAFDYFKAWVISKGEKVFDDIKSLKLSELKDHFNEDPQLEEMVSLSENVYENKTGEWMPALRVKTQKMIGTQWREDNLEMEYPELWKIFGH